MGLKFTIFSVVLQGPVKPWSDTSLVTVFCSHSALLIVSQHIWTEKATSYTPGISPYLITFNVLSHM